MNDEQPKAQSTADRVAPLRHPGPLHHGRKLTRAGLLHRFHGFLVRELQTLSWNMYGSRDFALNYQPLDHAVNVRCDSHFVGGKYKDGRKSYPFFDETKLPARARTVLKSLKIDTQRNDDVPARKPRRGGTH